MIFVCFVAAGFGGFVCLLLGSPVENPWNIAITSIPAVVLLILPSLMMAAPALTRWSRRRYWCGSQGPHSHFDGFRIRVVKVDGTVWFCCRDVHRALGIERRRQLLKALPRSEFSRQRSVGAALTVKGVRKLGTLRSDRRFTHFVRWSERTALPRRR